MCLREFSSAEFRYCKDLTVVSSSLSAHPPARAQVFPLSPVYLHFFHCSSLLQSSPISSVSFTSFCIPRAIPRPGTWCCKAKSQNCKASKQGASWQSPGGTEGPVWIQYLHIGMSLPGISKLMRLSKYCSLLWFGQVDKNDKRCTADAISAKLPSGSLKPWSFSRKKIRLLA